MIENIPVPLTFNPYKHHFRFLDEKITEWKNRDWQEVKTEIQKIGNNLLDFYLGKLSVDEICAESLSFFQQKKIIEKQAFLDWLKPVEYKKTILSDQSVWVVREGTDSERYIHIHPAKNSPHSMRIRATTLKTVVACRVLLNAEKGQRITLAQVNRVRKDYLNLSPVKSIQPGKGIYKIWQVFNVM